MRRLTAFVLTVALMLPALPASASLNYCTTHMAYHYNHAALRHTTGLPNSNGYKLTIFQSRNQSYQWYTSGTLNKQCPV